MANRYMVDCTHANLHKIDPAFLKTNQLVAGYDTGSSDVKWTTDDFHYVMTLGLGIVHVDQGFTGSPVTADTVRDVEPGAWNAVVAETKEWTAKRPTIYCDRNDLIEVLQLGWTKDIWLAFPMDHIPTKQEMLNDFPGLNKANLVAVQIGFTNVYDHSVVFDPYWPNPAPTGNTIVPHVLGMTEQDAAEAISKAHLHPHGPPLLRVIAQNPLPGKVVAIGSTVNVTVK